MNDLKDSVQTLYLNLSQQLERSQSPGLVLGVALKEVLYRLMGEYLDTVKDDTLIRGAREALPGNPLHLGDAVAILGLMKARLA